jgi:peptidoglycan/xylan/chitin deacetylase (PgdA/CDA1 family)
MKAIMYHYVRPAPEGLPYFRYLHVDDFVRQLDWFARESRFVTRQEFDDARLSGAAPEGVLLTFDDGLADHYRYVFPLLAERGLFAFFYVCTSPLQTRKLLDVHRIHLLLGRLGGQEALRRLLAHLDAEMLSDSHVEAFRKTTYGNQQNDGATTHFKRTLNYLISYDYREQVLDRMFQESFGYEHEFAKDFYLNPNQIREMDAAGMVIGSHGANHYVFSKIPAAKQRHEIIMSFDHLSEVIGRPVTTFCYPYGGHHTFTPETVAILKEAGCEFSFDVNPADITGLELRCSPQALPRYDCNMFPYGRASLGLQRAKQAA